MTTELLERIGDRRVVLSVSGGKDSAAASLYLRELGIEHMRVFANTGWEHPKTYEYLRGDLTRAIGPIHEVRNETLFAEDDPEGPPDQRRSAELRQPPGFARLVARKGMFPSRMRRFCTTELKVKPLAAFVRGLDEDCVNVVGVRAAESRARSKLPEWEFDEFFDCDVWRPLIGWSEAEVIGIHRRHGLRPNPLYLEGSQRVGCWPCIHAHKGELRRLSETDPTRIDFIRSLEREVQAAAAERRYARLGTTIEALGYEDPTFFQSANPETFCRKCNGTGLLVERVPVVSPLAETRQAGDSQLRLHLRVEGEHGPRTVETRTQCPKCEGKGLRRGMWPIDKAVAWSRTSRGGRALEMFSDPHDGCARWGMCESTSNPEAAE